MVKLKSKKGFWSGVKRIVLIIMILFFGSSLFFTVFYKFIPPPLTPLMLFLFYQPAKSDKTLKLQKNWVNLKNISDYMPAAVVTCEDQNFLSHHGFDFNAIKKAQKHNAKSKKKRGASTISQQTAKNVFLWPERSYFRKAMEVYFTVLIELIWGKKRIMEVYLNVIEMGDGIYGVDKAAEVYFNKRASDLSKRQCALIAVCLPNPIKMKPNKLTGYRLRRLSWAMRQMNYFYPVELNRKKRKKLDADNMHKYIPSKKQMIDPDPIDVKPEEFLEPENPVLPGEVFEELSDSVKTEFPDSLNN